MKNISLYITIIATLCAFFVACVVCADAEADRIKALPYLNAQLGRQFSGYLTVNATTGKALHYWFVESKRHASNDPVVLWLNGGPGCSSLDGYFYEHGPFIFDDSTTDLKLIERPYSWNRIANVIYLESPAGVGFSYSNTSSDYNVDDYQTATDNYNAIQAFLDRFPHFRDNDFYIGGESYAGVYVPSLAKNVVEGNLAGKKHINLKGILVGNGVTDPTSDSLTNSILPFLYGHGIYSAKLNNQLNQYCTSDPNGQQCQNLLNDVFNLMDDIDAYDIYSLCYHQRQVSNPLLKYMTNPPRSKRSAQDVPPCVDASKGTNYLNLPSVQKAINVKPATWAICSDAINYNSDIPSMVPYYQYLVGKNIKVLAYSGDADSVCPYTGTEYWTSNMLGLPEKQAWRQWTYKAEKHGGEQVGGMVTEYAGPLYFVTIKGAGHMVPQFKPEQGFVMFDRFLNDKPF
eukprot:TRINITY_DN13162_c0_g1_i1.p1 TRINITY_DN13162_c0_g1~~TRINITY_DN13162_c0_g1_i1.p1  ORF type:complete len:468 (-),score=109.39 TRINITY_DN13162_c0_g1_i1:96-1469(-)